MIEQRGAEIRVLLAGESRASMPGVRAVLDRAGYEVVAADDFRATLDLVDAFMPDVVVIGHGLPPDTGFDILGALRADHRCAGTGVVMVTDPDDHTGAVMALDLGADDFVRMPLDGDELLVRIQAVLHRRSLVVPARVAHAREAERGQEPAEAGGPPVPSGVGPEERVGSVGVVPVLRQRLPPLPPGDALRGLAGRPALRAVLARGRPSPWAAAAGTSRGSGAAVVGVRARGVRELNRRRGEQAGDEALRGLGWALVAAVGPEGAVGRLGGSTLAAVLAAGDPAGVLVRLRQEVAVRRLGVDVRAAAVAVDPEQPEAALVAVEDALDALGRPRP